MATFPRNTLAALTGVALGLISPAASAEGLPVNPDVTQENVGQTICVSGYSKSIRPPAAYTNAIKKERVLAMGLPLELIGDFTLDHRIAISSGGSPTDPKNLVLEDRDESYRKDSFENEMHRAICDGRISLREAQQRLWNWR